MSITRYLVFSKPPSDLFSTYAQAESVARKRALDDQGTEFQIWELTGDKISTVKASLSVTVDQV